VNSILEHQLNDVVKDYPTMYRVVIYKSPYDPTKIKRNKNRALLGFLSADSLDRSIRRTKRTLYDYIECNDFDLFVTFTFSPKKVNRYDMDAVYMKMQGWLLRQRQKSSDFGYVIVPEKHKDGAIHFHALISNAPFPLKQTNVIQDGHRVHNITGFRFGFTNASKIDPEDKKRALNYIAKYVTKDMVTIANRRRYWCSKNLKKPAVYHNAMYDIFGLRDALDHRTMTDENDFNVVYEVPKYLLD